MNLNRRRAWMRQAAFNAVVMLIILFWLGVAALHVAGAFGLK